MPINYTIRPTPAEWLAARRGSAPPPGPGFIKGRLANTETWTDQFGQKHRLAEMSTDHLANCRSYLEKWARTIVGQHGGLMAYRKRQLAKMRDVGASVAELRAALADWEPEAVAPVAWPHGQAMAAFDDGDVAAQQQALTDLSSALRNALMASIASAPDWVRVQPIYGAITDELRRRVPEKHSDAEGACPVPDCDSRSLTVDIVVGRHAPDVALWDRPVELDSIEPREDDDPLPGDDFLLGRCADCGRVRLLAQAFGGELSASEAPASATGRVGDPDRRTIAA